MIEKKNNALGEKKIDNLQEMEDIINKAIVCHIGFADGDKPYVLPFNFSYENKTIYLHSAMTGKKIDIITKNNNVCISFDIDHKLFYRDKEVACSYGMKFKSVLISGKIILIEDYNEKVRVLNTMMKKYAGEEFKYNSPAVNNVNVYKVEIKEISGKKYGY
jgi:uncharacterized protein